MTTTTRSQQPGQIDTSTWLKPLRKQHKQRHAAFWNVATGEIISERGSGSSLGPHAPLSLALKLLASLPDAIRPRSLFLIGGESAATTPRRPWWAEPVTEGWSYDGYELAAHAAAPTQQAAVNAGQYAQNGCQIDVRMSALWFPGVSSPRDCRDSWNALALALRRRFDDHATLLATPAMTGLDLLHRSLPSGYPLAPAELRDMLLANSGQGRFEFCPDPLLEGATIPGLWTLDARWMYAACVRHLPVGVPCHDYYPGGVGADEAYLNYRPGWYLINVTVPRDWSHRGLLARPSRDGAYWPAQPGQRIMQVWTTGAELGLALKEGWQPLIYERWLYYETVTFHQDPTRRWAETLRELRSEHSHQPAIAAAIRHLLIDTVGMWHRQAGRKLRITPLAQFPGAASGAQLHHIDRAAGLAHWYEPQPLTREAQAWQRPEWSTTVWGRARTRLNAAALRLPRAELVAYRADALVTCAEPDPALWLDDGQPGTFRLKDHVPGPLTMPASVEAMNELRRAARED